MNCHYTFAGRITRITAAYPAIERRMIAAMLDSKPPEAIPGWICWLLGGRGGSANTGSAHVRALLPWIKVDS
jgi:hypothetical protein